MYIAETGWPTVRTSFPVDLVFESDPPSPCFPLGIRQRVARRQRRRLSRRPRWASDLPRYLRMLLQREQHQLLLLVGYQFRSSLPRVLNATDSIIFLPFSSFFQRVQGRDLEGYLRRSRAALGSLLPQQDHEGGYDADLLGDLPNRRNRRSAQPRRWKWIVDFGELYLHWRLRLQHQHQHQQQHRRSWTIRFPRRTRLDYRRWSSPRRSSLDLIRRLLSSKVVDFNPPSSSSRPSLFPRSFDPSHYPLISV